MHTAACTVLYASSSTATAEATAHGRPDDAGRRRRHFAGDDGPKSSLQQHLRVAVGPGATTASRR